MKFMMIKQKSVVQFHVRSFIFINYVNINPRPARLKILTDEQSEKLVKGLLQEDRQVICKEISQIIGIPSVFHNLTKQLQKRNTPDRSLTV